MARDAGCVAPFGTKPTHRGAVSSRDGGPSHLAVADLLDLGEELDRDELRRCFERACELGLLDPGALRAARRRVEWRPLRVTVDALIDEFTPSGT